MIQLMVASVITSVSFLASIQTLSKSRNQFFQDRDRQVAEAYAAELLETFRSLKTRELITYFKSNPQNPGLPPYRLCAGINVLERTDESRLPRYLNPDPNVALGKTVLDGNSSKLDANRSYMFQIVDVATNPQTPVVLTAHCNKTVTDSLPSSTQYAFDPIGRPNERLLVTVAVTWVPAEGGGRREDKVTLSLILPN